MSWTATQGPGTHYTYAQLEGLWINAGGPRSMAPLMAAIAEAESRGWSGAENKTDNGGRQTSWGLWQISNGTHNQPVPGILNPATNAQQAVAKYHSQGLTAWGTYTSGAYKAFISNSTAPDTAVPYPTSSQSWANASPGSAGSSDCLFGIGEPNGIPVPFGHIGPFCLLSKSNVRCWTGIALMGVGAVGLLIFGSMVASAFGVNPVGKLGEVAGGVTETVGAGVSLVAPEVGVPMAAAGHEVKQHGARKAGQQAAVRRGKRKLKEKRENRAEDEELAAKGASDITKARKPAGTLGKPTHPGRVTGSVPADAPADVPPF